MICKVVHGQQHLTGAFQVRTGVRQGYLLSPVLFLLAVDWVLKNSMSERQNGIQWTLRNQLDELDFADDLVLLSHTHKQMQDKTSAVAEYSRQVGLNIHRGKTKTMRVHTNNQMPISLEGEALEEVDNFNYLSSIMDKQGGTDTDVKVRIGKARAAFNHLKNIWKSGSYSVHTKIRLFNFYVKPVLLYGSETWRTTLTTTKMIQTFINTCLQRILTSTSRKPSATKIFGNGPDNSRWKKKPPFNTTKQALMWNPPR